MKPNNAEFNQKNNEMFRRLKTLKYGSEEYIALRNEIWVFNHRLILEQLKQEKAHYCTDNCEYTDIIQECELHLVRAIERFNPDQGNNFSTYAWYWVRQGLQKCMRHNHIVHIPEHVQAYAWVKDDIKSRFIKSLTNQESLDEMYGQEDVLYDIPVNELFIHGMRGSEEDVSQTAEYHDLRRIIGKITKVLRPREKEMLYLYYAEEMTLEDIGKIYKLTRNRVRQIIARAVLKLRYLADQNHLRTYL